MKDIWDSDWEPRKKKIRPPRDFKKSGGRKPRKPWQKKVKKVVDKDKYFW